MVKGTFSLDNLWKIQLFTIPLRSCRCCNKFGTFVGNLSRKMAPSVNGYIYQGVSDHLKNGPKVFFLLHKFALIKQNIFMKTNSFTCLMTKSIRNFFWRKLFDICGFLDFFLGLRFVFWTYIKWNSFLTLIIKGFLMTNHVV